MQSLDPALDFRRWTLDSPGNRTRRSLRTAAFFSCVICFAAQAAAGDWPQILGPHRNGVADGERIQPWGAGGPRTLWTYPLGEGYAGPAVLGERVVVFHRVGDIERVEALDAATGQSRWKADFRATYAPGVDPDTGPRCVPLIHDGAVYVYGAAGDLHGVKLADGKKLWSRSMLRDFNGDEGYFGAGSSPLVVAGRLLVNVGGRAGAGLVAVGLSDGATLWQATDERASYSAPTAVVLDGRPHAVFVTRLNVVCVDPRDGVVRVRFPFGQRGATVNAATPLVGEFGLFVTASYGVGARLAKFSRNGFELVWENDESLSSQYPTPVVRDGFLYGVHGREDVGVGQLRCVEAATGKVRWSVPDFGMAHLILTGDRLLVLSVQGRLRLATASPDRLDTLATATVSTSVTRALPALANGRLYVRETSGQGGNLRCFNLKP